MTPHQQDRQSNQKMGKGPEQTLLQGGHTEGLQTYEKILNITSHQRDANQNHNGISPHTAKMAIINKSTNNSSIDF